VDLATAAKERARREVTRDEWSEEAPSLLGGRRWNDFCDFDEWPDGPIAVIHADGSGVGKRLLQLSSHDEQQEFSEALKRASDAATTAAVETLSSTRGKILARPIVAAGDDLTYILPAKGARKFCETWLSAFEDDTRSRERELKGQLYGGAGLVYVHQGYPFSKAYELAESLCKRAKDRIKDRSWEKSVMAFKRVTNSLVDDVNTNAAAWVLIEGKVTPLNKLVSVVRQLPRGPLRTWLDHFQRPDGEIQASRLWARMQEVTDSHLWNDFVAALAAAGADPRSGAFVTDGNEPVGIPLADLDDGERATPIADALALRFLEQVESKESEEALTR
jgi:hypothetical protein